MDKFISCDWGTSAFRLRLVDTGNQQTHAEVKTNEGIADTYQQWLATARPESERLNFYRRKLSDATSRLSGDFPKNTPIVLSGMASSSMGLAELPYQSFPFSWDAARLPVRRINEDENFSHPLYLVSGFKTESDVMRGEESMLLGCEVTDNDERIFIFPGTHSKHVFVRNKSGEDFKSYMTGEIFNLLSEKSILRHAVESGPDEKSFAEGLRAGFNGNLLHQAFMVRTRQLLHNADPVSGYQFLSGLLIGTELGQLKDNKFPVFLVCTERFKEAYHTGLKMMNDGREIIYVNADEALLNGHGKIAEHFIKP
jgi:2-dehydro-3-deoxygalactonokinase